MARRLGNADVNMAWCLGNADVKGFMLNISRKIILETIHII